MTSHFVAWIIVGVIALVGARFVDSGLRRGIEHYWVALGLGLLWVALVLAVGLAMEFMR